MSSDIETKIIALSLKNQENPSIINKSKYIQMLLKT